MSNNVHEQQEIREQEWIKAVEVFGEAAYKLTVAWERLSDPDIGTDAYPFQHDFAEEANLIGQWVQHCHAEMTRRARDPRIGTRVRFRAPVERYPHALVEAGEVGTVAVVTRDLIAVHLDKVHDGLDEWDNEIHFSDNMDLRGEFFTACEVLA